MADVQDIAIIGTGPLGLEMAVALRRAGLSYVHFESRQIGSTIQWWAPGTRWFSSPERIAIAGVPLQGVMQEKTSREEYLAYLRGVVQQFDLRVQTYRKVVGICRCAEGFELEISQTLNPEVENERVRVRRVILTVGGRKGRICWGLRGKIGAM